MTPAFRRRLQMLLDAIVSWRDTVRMIKTFADKEAEKIFNETRSRKLPQNIQQRALMKLNRLHFAAQIEDLRAFPGDRLELLHPPELGEWSIRVND